MCVCGGGQRQFQELELEAVVSCPARVLAVQLRSSSRVDMLGTAKPSPLPLLCFEGWPYCSKGSGEAPEACTPVIFSHLFQHACSWRFVLGF